MNRRWRKEDRLKLYIPHPIHSELSIVHDDQEDRKLFELFSSAD